MSIKIQCLCGNQWDIDEDPTPETCLDGIWRLSLDGSNWEIWVDPEGNPVDVT